MANMKVTPNGSSYWNQTGAYQKEYEELSKQDLSNTLHGALLDAALSLHYDCFNNGNCNAFVAIGEIRSDFNAYLDLIITVVPCIDVIVEDIRETINHCGMYGLEDLDINDVFATYNVLLDNIMYYILNNENDEIPDWHFQKLEKINSY